MLIVERVLSGSGDRCRHGYHYSKGYEGFGLRIGNSVIPNIQMVTDLFVILLL